MEKPKQIINDALMGTQCQLSIVNDNVNVQKYKIEFGTYKPYQMNKEVVQYVGTSVLKHQCNANVIFGTEIYVNNVLYRAHPSYRSSSEWYDYCFYKSPRMHFNRVAKLLGFFSNTHDNENQEQNHTNAETHSS